MPTLHKRVESPFLRLVAAVLFLAFSAWSGAFLLGELPRAAAEAAVDAPPVRGLALRGVAVRREILPAIAPDVPDGTRLSAAQTAGAGAGLWLLGRDGFEDLGPDALETLTPAALRALLDREAAPEPQSGKLMRGWAWYYAALSDGGSEAPPPGRCRLLFDGFSESLPARLIRVQEQDGALLLVFRLTAGGEALHLRKTGALLLDGA